MNSRDKVFLYMLVGVLKQNHLNDAANGLTEYIKETAITQEIITVKDVVKKKWMVDSFTDLQAELITGKLKRSDQLVLVNNYITICKASAELLGLVNEEINNEIDKMINLSQELKGKITNENYKKR